MKYSSDIIKNALEEIKNGSSKSYISRKYNIPRSTIIGWTKDKKEKIKIDIENLDKYAYSYILGLYLGDGYINKTPKTYRLRISLDSRQDLVMDECLKNLKILFPNNKISIIKYKSNCISVSVHSNFLPLLFPHLGDGKKYKREIIFNNFENKNLDDMSLIKGLFHSDGSYFLSEKKYPRYQFTNRSLDLINIFSNILINNFDINPKIRQRKTGVYDIQIQNKKDVDKLFLILGTKYYNK